MSPSKKSKIQFNQTNPYQLKRVLIPNRKKLPEIGAIYFVISKKEELLYIGQTENLKKRWHKHECGLELDRPKETYVAWVKVEDGDYRKKLEKILIRKYKPLLNRVAKKTKKKRNLSSQKLINKKTMKNKPTKSELEILSVLWEKKEATVREVFEVINSQKGTSYTTVLKLMQIMFDKGLVERNEEKRAHVYRARIKQNETGKQMLNEVMDKVFGGSALKLVQQVLENETTSAEEMSEIRKMIEKAELEAKGK